MDSLAKYRGILDEAIQLCKVYLEKAITALPYIDDIYDEIDIDKDLYVINSRYMNRGYFCPSPDLEYIVTNIKRGSIVKRLSQAKNITHRYLFDKDDKMRVCETYFPKFTRSEYIFHEDNVVYGVVYNSYNRISILSVAKYDGDKIISYMETGLCYDYDISQYYTPGLTYEICHYEHPGHLDTEFYDISCGGILIKCIKNRYRLDENGKIVSKSIIPLQCERIWLDGTKTVEERFADLKKPLKRILL